MKNTLMFSLLALMTTPVWAEAPAASAPAGWSQSQTPTAAVPAAPAARPVSEPPLPNGAGLSGSDPLPPPSPLYAQAEEAVSPLTPDEIRQLRARQSDVTRAMISPSVSVVP
ncbi:conjugal transfer protein TraN, partial [Serratia fonticola]|nr:conjugal transfer protein TraN [Serratia fonticola]